MAAKHWLDKFKYFDTVAEARAAAKPGQYIMSYQYARGAGGGPGSQFLAVGPQQRRTLQFDSRFRTWEKVEKSKRTPKGAKIVFQPKKEIRGELLSFTDRLFAKQIPGRKGWFVHGHERTGNYYGGNYVTLVAWPNYPVNNRARSGYNRAAPGWRTKAEAERAVKVLTRFVRMGKAK